MAADGGESGVETDPYTVLDVPRSASLADIRRAYRRLARSVHPDVGGSDEAFKKLTRALYAALAEAKSRQEWEAAEPRRKARARAASTWNDVRERAAARAGGSGGSADPGFQRARTRREAEEEETEASELRRRRWREIAFDGVWREHMPLRARPSQEARAAFLSAMEGAVQAYVDGGARKAESESLAARLDEQVWPCASAPPPPPDPPPLPVHPPSPSSRALFSSTWPGPYFRRLRPPILRIGCSPS